MTFANYLAESSGELRRRQVVGLRCRFNECRFIPRPLLPFEADFVSRATDVATRPSVRESVSESVGQSLVYHCATLRSLLWTAARIRRSWQWQFCFSVRRSVSMRSLFPFPFEKKKCPHIIEDARSMTF